MKRYKVDFLSTANEDLWESFEWGVEAWGALRAQRWLQETYATCRERLSSFPMAYPIAPESSEFDLELRHLVLGRYRVVFTVNEEAVTVLYVRGPYAALVGLTKD